MAQPAHEFVTPYPAPESAGSESNLAEVVELFPGREAPADRIGRISKAIGAQREMMEWLVTGGIRYQGASSGAPIEIGTYAAHTARVDAWRARNVHPGD